MDNFDPNNSTTTPAPDATANPPQTLNPAPDATANPPRTLNPAPTAAVVPPPTSIPPPPSKFYKGFSIGCLVAAGIVVLVFLLCIGSCVAMISSSLREHNLDSEFTGKKTAASQQEVRPGTDSKKIAMISVQGIIARSAATNFLGDQIGASAKRICKQLRTAMDDDDIAGAILDMDTPGGEVVASDEIRKAVDAFRAKGKPVVTCIHSMGASGGYFIASGSDWIVANRMALTGSVGVIMESMQAQQLLEKIGVQPMVYRSGKFKDIMSPMRAPTDAEKAYIDAMIQETFLQFCQVVSDGRKQFFKDAEAVRSAEFGDGRPVSGQSALDYHLVDQLGDFDDAVAKARELSKHEDAPVVAYMVQPNWMELLLSMASRTPALKVEGLPALPNTALKPGVMYYLMPEAATL